MGQKIYDGGDFLNLVTKKRRAITILSIVLTIICIGIAYQQFNSKEPVSNPMESLTIKKFLAMDADQFQSLLEKKGCVFISNFSSHCDEVYEKLGCAPPSSKLRAKQQLLGVCVEWESQSRYGISEVVAHPLSQSGDAFQELDGREAASLYLDHRIKQTDAAAEPFAQKSIYYIFYHRNRDITIDQLAAAKITISLTDVKNQDHFAYDHASANFELYCAPNVEMKEYLVGFQVPEQPQYTLLEETFFTSENMESGKPYEAHEILNKFIHIYAPSWQGISLTGNTGSAYKISPR